jgi:hypothetical protein
MSIDTQVEELLAQLTPAEKAGRLTQDFYFRLPARPSSCPAASSSCCRRRRRPGPRWSGPGSRARARSCGYWDEESTPLYPFGHGLSYSSFTYADPLAEPARTTPDGTTTISVRVTNTGDRVADEVQLYLHQRHGTASRPVLDASVFDAYVGGSSAASATTTFEVSRER